MQLVGGFFATALLLVTCIPLFLTAQRQAEASARRSRMHAMAREIAGRLREDVRQASRVEVREGGRGLRLTLSSVDGTPSAQVVYRQAPAGLVREVRPGTAGRPAERSAYAAPLSEARFRTAGGGVSAALHFRETVHHRDLRLDVECSAVPRSTR